MVFRRFAKLQKTLERWAANGNENFGRFLWFIKICRKTTWYAKPFSVGFLFRRDYTVKMTRNAQIRHICKKNRQICPESCRNASGVGSIFGFSLYATTNRKTGGRFRNCFQKKVSTIVIIRQKWHGAHKSGTFARKTDMSDRNLAKMQVICRSTYKNRSAALQSDFSVNHCWKIANERVILTILVEKCKNDAIFCGKVRRKVRFSRWFFADLCYNTTINREGES